MEPGSGRKKRERWGWGDEGKRKEEGKNERSQWMGKRKWMQECRQTFLSEQPWKKKSVLIIGSQTMFPSGHLSYENVCSPGCCGVPCFSQRFFFHIVPHYECFLCSKYNGQYEAILTLALSSGKVQTKEKMETEMNICKNKRRRDIKYTWSSTSFQNMC